MHNKNIKYTIMKNFKILSLTILSIVLFSCSGKAQENQSKVDKSISEIELIDFYGTHRCVTCKAIEANARYTLKTYFEKEIKEGLLSFKTINVDDEKNYKMAENYQAAGTALFINVIKNGKETHIDLTDFAFANGRDQEEFSKELKAKIETELKKL